MRDRGARHRQLVEVSSLGLMFPLCIGAGYLVGRWLDRGFGTAPWLTIVFSCLGVIAAFVNLFRVSMKDDGTTTNGDGAERGGERGDRERSGP